jgi:hypothetical protein
VLARRATARATTGVRAAVPADPQRPPAGAAPVPAQPVGTTGRVLTGPEWESAEVLSTR